MSKIQIAGATAELEKALEAMNKEKGISLPDWFSDCFEINDAMEEVGLIVKLDWYSTESDGFVQCGYWSEKIKHWIVLDSEVKFDDEKFSELAEKMVEYNDRARKLEAKLPNLRR